MRQLFMCCGFLIVLASGFQTEAASFEFTLQAGKSLRKDCLVWINLPEGLQQAAGLKLRVQGSETPIPCQLSEDHKRLVFIFREELTANGSRSYTVSTAPKPVEQVVRCVEEPGMLKLILNDQPVLTYHTAIVEPPAGESELYRRSGYIHPFVTPAGKIVTDGFPSDHMHQHAIFSAWTKTFFEGEQIDFWNQKAGTGTVFHREVLGRTSGPVYASFQVRLQHTVIKEQEQPVLDEIWTVRLYNIRDVRLFDLESVQTCIAKSPLTLAEYHYGGFALRGSSEWIPKGTHKLITNETEDRMAGNHTRPNWVSLSGPVAGDVAGAAMFSHPTNFRSPQPVRLHPSMPYFVYSPCVLGAFDLEPGKPYYTQHRYVAFDGEPVADRLSRLWEDYSAPPQIHWKPAQ